MIVGVLLIIVTYFGQPARVYAERAESPAACEARFVELSVKLAKLPGFKAASHSCFPVKVDDSKVAD